MVFSFSSRHIFRVKMYTAAENKKETMETNNGAKRPQRLNDFD